MKKHQPRLPDDLAKKKELLETVYRVYTRWIERFPLVCRQGCAACCTRSVTMTSLEGEILLDFIRLRKKEDRLSEKLAAAGPGKSRNIITTNQFAAACLSQQEIDQDGPGSWDFSPCVFLEGDACSIYEARPFGCRSFGSFVQCSAGRPAEVGPLFLTVNTVFSQVIEHLSSDGGYWANMTDILENLLEKKDSQNLVAARQVPGFLLEVHEVGIVRALLLSLKKESKGAQTFGDLIDNFMPIE